MRQMNNWESSVIGLMFVTALVCIVWGALTGDGMEPAKATAEFLEVGDEKGD